MFLSLRRRHFKNNPVRVCCAQVGRQTWLISQSQLCIYRANKEKKAPSQLRVVVPRGLRHVTKPRLTTSALTKNRQIRIKRCRSARVARPKPNSERWLAMDQMRRTIEHEKGSVWEGAKCVFPTGFSATRPLETSIFINSFILFCFRVTHTWLIVPRMPEK